MVSTTIYQGPSEGLYEPEYFRDFMDSLKEAQLVDMKKQSEAGQVEINYRMIDPNFRYVNLRYRNKDEQASVVLTGKEEDIGRVEEAILEKASGFRPLTRRQKVSMVVNNILDVIGGERKPRTPKDKKREILS